MAKLLLNCALSSVKDIITFIIIQIIDIESSINYVKDYYCP